MNYKKVLRFYFNADELDKTLNNVILRWAQCSASAEGRCEYYAEKICKVIGVKIKLGELWDFINAIICGLNARDVRSLESYSSMRGGFKRLCEEEKKEFHRAVVKFSRRVNGRLNSYSSQVGVLAAYYCLIK